MTFNAPVHDHHILRLCTSMSACGQEYRKEKARETGIEIFLPPSFCIFGPIVTTNRSSMCRPLLDNFRVGKETANRHHQSLSINDSSRALTIVIISPESVPQKRLIYSLYDLMAAVLTTASDLKVSLEDCGCNSHSCRPEFPVRLCKYEFWFQNRDNAPCPACLSLQLTYSLSH